MMPVAEPAGDIRAQLAAALSPYHPKRACYLVPADASALDAEALRQAGVHVISRGEGTLVTLDAAAAEAFIAAPAETDAFDTAMAGILDFIEDKPTMSKGCYGKPEVYSRAVQARDAEEHVVHEVFVSPLRLLAACDALESYVPPGGALAVLHPVLAISRRVAMRWVETRG